VPVDFATSAEDPAFTAEVIFTDGLCFTMTGITNTQNEHTQLIKILV
jgi:hypothetical protein